MRKGLAMMSAIIMMAGWAMGHSDMQHQPAKDNSSRGHDTEFYDHYYRLFTQMIYGCPTSMQTEVIETMEGVYQLTQGWLRDPANEEDRAKTAREILACYTKARQDHAILYVHWDRAGASMTADDEPLLLARGIGRPVLAEVENLAPAKATLSIAAGGAIQSAAIPPAEMRPVLFTLVVDDAETDRVEFVLTDQEGTPRVVGLDVRVEEPAILKGRLIESATQEVFPGRVYVECSDNVLRHGKAYADNSTLSEKPVIFRPASYRLPFFYSDGQFEIAVPPGPTAVTLERGFEHPLVSKEITLEPGAVQAITLESGRFLDMKEQGWISGDTHIHWVENRWDVNEDIALLALVQRAEDLRVANNLTLYQWRPDPLGSFIKPDQYPMGPVPGHCNENYHIQMAEEYRNDNFYGHINLLNIKELIQPIATGRGSGGDETALDYPLNKTAIEECHSQGGISCEAHGLGPFERSSVIANVVSSLSDVLDQMDPPYYYRFLDCGFRIPLGNGSDHPARVAGCARVYVKVDGPFSYEGWIDGLRQARSFTTSGPLLFLTVNGKDIGTRLNIAQGEEVEVHARAVSRYPIGVLQVVSNGGEVLREVQSSRTDAELRFTMPVDSSRWFVARCSQNEHFAPIRTAETYHTARPHIAHTSGIYVDVDGEPVFRKQAAEEWITLLKQLNDDIKARAVFANDAQRQEALDYIRDGIQQYEVLIEKYAHSKE